MINLSSLNGYVTLNKLKMETVSSVLGSIKKGDFLFLIDHEGTCFQILIHLDCQPFLWITLERKVYQVKALCFDLSTVPKAFVRVFALVWLWAHGRGIRLPHYVVITELVPLPLQHREQLVQLCKDLGIVFNLEKSDLEPTSRA